MVVTQVGVYPQVRSTKSKQRKENIMLKDFIPLGKKGSYLNKNCVDFEHSYVDTKINKAVIIDKYGLRYLVAPELIKGKIELPIKEGK